MRIDLYSTAASQISADAPGTSAALARRQTSPSGEDTATFSSGSLSVPSLTAQALSAAEVRLARVDALQQAFSSGAYTLDPSLIAEALLNEHV